MRKASSTFFFKELLKDFHHEFHGGVVVIVQKNRVPRRFFQFRAAFFYRKTGIGLFANTHLHSIEYHKRIGNGWGHRRKRERKLDPIPRSTILVLEKRGLAA